MFLSRLLAAIYLDGGMDSARAFISRIYKDRLHEYYTVLHNSKTALQEWAHKVSLDEPIYNVSSRDGPDHDPLFVIEVTIGKDGTVVHKASASGASKRIAETDAACSLLLDVGAWVRSEDGSITDTSVAESAT